MGDTPVDASCTGTDTVIRYESALTCSEVRFDKFAVSFRSLARPCVPVTSLYSRVSSHSPVRCCSEKAWAFAGCSTALIKFRTLSISIVHENSAQSVSRLFSGTSSKYGLPLLQVPKPGMLGKVARQHCATHAN